MQLVDSWIRLAPNTLFMNHFHTLLLFFLIQFTASAQTIISTPTVSGTWTSAGSPYIIQNEIEVSAADQLTIEPGVVVRFQPTTKMMIFGQLIAVGTAASPIVFEATDTTGWSNESTTAGGWSGIHYRQYGGSGTDNSSFKYCTVKDVKYGYNTILNYTNTFTVLRGLEVHHCTFRHNNSGTALYAAGPMFNVQTFQPADTVDIYLSDFTDNICQPALIYLTNYPNGYSSVRSCHLYQNSRGSCIEASVANTVLEDNELDNNTAVYNSCPIKANGMNVIIRGNRIHHNVSENYGAVSCEYGEVTVENNLICNNIQTLSTCGYDQGGGGIHISCNGNDVNNGFFIVRNNIIANNYGALAGGGIYLYQARACISNNHIINNATPTYGSAICISGNDSQVYVRSNLFYAQSSPGAPITDDIIHVYSGSNLWFDYNLIPSTFSQSVQTSYSFTLYGDTINNVITTDPGLVALTADDNYLTDATTTDFNLLANSPCINQGDTVGAFPALIDYAGNNRFNGVIDIGAYEYLEHTSGISSLSEEVALQIYPNPGATDQDFTVMASGKGELIVYDMDGAEVFRQSLTNGIQHIRLHVSPGMYYARFIGDVYTTTKLCIQ